VSVLRLSLPVETLVGAKFEGTLVKPMDIKVLTGDMSFPDIPDPFPPLENVLATGLWKDPAYAALRNRLTKPLPSPQFQDQGTFMSVSKVGQGDATVLAEGGDVTQTAEGVTHILALGHGCPMAKELLQLQFALTVVDLTVDPAVKVQPHPYLVQLLLRRTFVLLHGTRTRVSLFARELEDMLSPENLKHTEILMCRKSLVPKAQFYHASLSLWLLSLDVQIPFQVTHPPPLSSLGSACVCLGGSPGTGIGIVHRFCDTLCLSPSPPCSCPP
jgi:hypothetical protein